ncbi:MAG TPA: preprotein translocase subunit SecA [Firmicutes bacterium]|nr:preprotein translocase subunit SecA [Bacillota bacterium]
MKVEEREVNKYRSLAERVTSLEPRIQKLSDSEIRDTVQKWREPISEVAFDHEKREAKMMEALPDVFACVREAGKRTIGLRAYDVQIMGAIVLHQGRIAEMKTGEGKTLVASFALTLNGLAGRGAHLVTVNDYLAKRDANWKRPIYEFCGLTVDFLQNGQERDDRVDAYHADVTYGTNSEFGFDYLRDNMVVDARNRVQSKLYYAIVDEVDSILIDEARTPLIISGQPQQATEQYQNYDRIIRRLRKDVHYETDDKEKSVNLTEEGMDIVEKSLGITDLYDPDNAIHSHHIQLALKAHALFKKDIDYVVKDGQVIIVDEFTGRLMMGRRFSEGQHQAIEAKENVRVQSETQTMATITIQNYYRLYEKLAGMTGTAKTEEEEFQNIYGMNVVVLPTHMKMIRDDRPDLVYKTKKGKFGAVVEDIKDCYKRGQPTLVGTTAVETSEMLSALLKREKIPHNVLNAKNHEREAEIVKDAGQKHAVTIATNMAGRGTDIKLGEGVVEAGGLHIIGTERHESRRIDNQLRGRSGRQGDPGSSRFYVSLEDDLMRIFGGDRVKNLMDRFGMEEDMPIESGLVSRQIENAQKKVEAHNFEIRKHVLKYDDIMERQRSVVYRERNAILDGEDIKPSILKYIEDVIAAAVMEYCNPELKKSEWNYDELLTRLRTVIPYGDTIRLPDIEGKPHEQLIEFLTEQGQKLYDMKEKMILDAGMNMRELERYVVLNMIDRHWVDHLRGLDDLRDGIGMQSYAQKDPLVVYTKESHLLFEAMRRRFKEHSLRFIFAARIVQREKSIYETAMTATHGGGTSRRKPVVKSESQKIGRNDPCPCGSGKKYKKCCGAKS